MGWIQALVPSSSWSVIVICSEVHRVTTWFVDQCGSQFGYCTEHMACALLWSIGLTLPVHLLSLYWSKQRTILRSTSLHHSATLQSLRSTPLHVTTTMSSHNSASGTLRCAYSPIDFPDTPEARRIVASISAQHARRAAAHHSIFQSPQTEPATNVATPLPSNTLAHGMSMAPRQLFAAESADQKKNKAVVVSVCMFLSRACKRSIRKTYFLRSSKVSRSATSSRLWFLREDKREYKTV